MTSSVQGWLVFAVSVAMFVCVVAGGVYVAGQQYQQLQHLEMLEIKTEQSLQEVEITLNEVREQVARIEGYLSRDDNGYGFPR